MKYKTWSHVLRGMRLDISNLSPVEAARSLMASGDEQQARPIWESVLAEKGQDSEAFQMLLRCDVTLGEFRDYREHHRKYGSVHGMVYPDFDYLDNYLKSIRNTIFLVVCPCSKGTSLGTAFAIGAHCLVTCRHVVEDVIPEKMRLIGDGCELSVLEVKHSTRYDVALIRVAEELASLRLSGFNSASPGESILAVGFPHPDSLTFDDNLFISRGVINSVRKATDGRWIFIDAKIASGNSGGPLMNSLGEVIGVNTLTLRHFSKSDDVSYTDFEQPIAIPIWQMRTWIEQNMMR